MLVAGEPGVGKTSLATAGSDVARDAGCLVAWGRCRETEGAPPYWPWVQLLRALSRATGEDLVGLLPPLGSVPATGMETDRFRLFDRVSGGIADAGCGTPLFLVLDDLHRADEASIGLLRFLATSISDRSMVIVGTYRDTEVTMDSPVGRLVGELAGLGVLALIELAGLSREDTALLIASRGVHLDDAAVSLLQDRTGGNPFFLSELLSRTRPDATAVPASVGAAIGMRVATLPGTTRELLLLAAVLGRDIRTDLLSAAVGAPAAEVLRVLEPAIEAGLVVPRAEAPDSYQFRHVLVQQALSSSLSSERRVQLHDLATRTLSELVGDDPLWICGMAHHAVEAVSRPGGRQRAYTLACRAARSAARQLAYETAAEWFSTALGLHVSSDDEERLRLALELGGAAGRAGHLGQARAAYEQVWQEAARRGSVPLLAEAALGLGDVVVSAGTVDAGLTRMLERTLARIGEDHPSLKVRLAARLATELYWGGGLDRARRLAREAVEMARTLDDRRALAAALAAEQFVLRGPDHLATRLAVGEELVALATDLDDEALELQGRRLLVPDRLQDDVGAADREIESLSALASESRLPLAEWYVVLFRAIRATMTGQIEPAEVLIPQAETLGQRIEAQPASIYAAGQRFALLRQCHRVNEAENEVRRSAARWPVLVTFRCELALLLADLGRREETIAILDGLVAGRCAALPRDSLWLASVSMLAEAAAEIDATQHAEVLHDLLRPYAGRVAFQGVVVWWGAVDYYLARTAAALGRWGEAEQAFQSALQLHEAWGATPFIHTTLTGFAAMLRRRASAGDRDRAVRLAGQAASLTAVRRPAGVGFGLTAREKEILDLVAGGQSNKEIARRMDLSIHTVERHVANLYAKIGARNRADATAYALRGGSRG